MKRQPYMIWWAILVHLAWGIALILDPSVAPVAILLGLHWILTLGVTGVTLGLLLLAAALLATWSLLAGRRLSNTMSLLLLMPQYALLVAALIADAQSTVTGDVDGREIDRMLLFTVLCPVMIAALLHSAAIVERHLTWAWTRR